MTDQATIEAVPKRKGKGAGKPAPSFILTGNNYEEWVKNGPSPPPKRLRRARYNKKIGDEICAELRLGKTLRSICHARGIWPDVVLEWADTNPLFAQQYARDLSFGYDILGQQTLDEAYAKLKPEDIPLARHRFDVNRWYLARRSPKRWGDKVEVHQEITGPGGGPIQVDVMIAHILSPENIAKLTEAEIDIWQQALATVPRLLAPPGSGAKVIEGKAVEVPPSSAPVEE